MAKQEKGSARTSLEGINDSLSSFEQKVEQNKKYIYWVLAGVATIVAGVLIYIYAIRNPGIEDAKKQISQADMVLLQQNNPDSALTLYKRVFDNSSYKPANRAGQMAGILLYQKGKYDEAIQYLEKTSADGKIAGPAVKSLLGDCYVNKKNYDKALSAYDDAIKLAGDNANYTPTFMLKKATVQHALKKYDGELETYEALKSKFPQYSLMNNFNIDKYIERAKALAGK